MNLCRYCNQPVDVLGTDYTYTVAYWHWGHCDKERFLCHKSCKVVKQEAYDCQLIDADCNDCKHFQRGKLAELLISMTKTPDGRWVEIPHQPDLFYGHCLKFNRPTVAQPNKWTGMECFEHRRSATEGKG